MKKVIAVLKNGNQISTSKWEKIDDLILGYELSYCIIDGVVTFNTHKVYDYLNN